MKRKILIQLVVIFTLFSCADSQKSDPWIVTAPAGDRFVSINKSGETVIPNGRIVAPVGKSIVVAPHPYGLTLSPDGNTAVTANSGTNPLSITIIRNILSEEPESTQTVSFSSVPPSQSGPINLHTFLELTAYFSTCQEREQ